MAFTGSAMLNITSLANVLNGAQDGRAEVLGVLAEAPFLVVDLDSPGDIETLHVPTQFPSVIAGISRTGAVVGSLNGVDVALASGAQSAFPWVSALDLETEVQHLAAKVGASPQASVTLVQVLRAGRSDSLDHDLLLESLAYSALQGGSEFHRWLAHRPPMSPRPMEDSALVVDRDGARLNLTLNRPQTRNAYNAAMRDELCEALSLVCADPSVKEVHIYGAGQDFCSGGDLGEFGTHSDSSSAHLIRSTRSAARWLGVVGDRVTAHLHGACIGAGIELPALAHRIIADPATQVQLPEVAMGLIPGAGGTATLPRRIGRHRTAWLALSGQAIDAATALAWGLVDEIDQL